MNKSKIKASVRSQIEGAVRAILHERIEDLDAPQEGRFTSRFRKVAEELLRSHDQKVQLQALELLMAYGYGKPVQPSESKVETTQTFIAEIPPVQDNDTWLANYGSVAPAPDLSDN